MKFKPEVLYVNKGDSVVFINKDMVDHDVTDEPGGSWTSTTLNPGQSWGKTITRNEDYFCSLHVIMKGKIRLENQ
ncbi:MAG: hypothetical protein DHS20C17_36090 [Cyclobacteriaceae bacterium]|nr:MAG: hypothetical protein DHS20C17_36090 [Cyclobacteriaceae bacterium]